MSQENSELETAIAISLLAAYSANPVMMGGESLDEIRRIAIQQARLFVRDLCSDWRHYDQEKPKPVLTGTQIRLHIGPEGARAIIHYKIATGDKDTAAYVLKHLEELAAEGTPVEIEVCTSLDDAAEGIWTNKEKTTDLLTKLQDGTHEQE